MKARLLEDNNKAKLCRYRWKTKSKKTILFQDWQKTTSFCKTLSSNSHRTDRKNERRRKAEIKR